MHIIMCGLFGFVDCFVDCVVCHSVLFACSCVWTMLAADCLCLLFALLACVSLFVLCCGKVLFGLFMFPVLGCLGCVASVGLVYFGWLRNDHDYSMHIP